MLVIEISVRSVSWYSATELVFNTTLKLLDVRINPPTDSKKLDLETYVDQSRNYMFKLESISTREQLQSAYVPKDLSTCMHV